MEGIRGRRKTILLVSEGISYDVLDVFANTSAGIVQQQASDAVAAATRGNVAIYAIDPRGLTAFEETIEVGGTPIDITPSQFSVTGALQNSLRVSQQSLRMLADETGGFAAVNRNDLSEAFARIVRENSAYYVLGLLPEQRSARRPVPASRGAREASRPAGARPPRICRAARACARRQTRGDGRRRRKDESGRHDRAQQPDSDRRHPADACLRRPTRARRPTRRSRSRSRCVSMTWSSRNETARSTTASRWCFPRVDQAGTIRAGEPARRDLGAQAGNAGDDEAARAARPLGHRASSRPVSIACGGGGPGGQPIGQRAVRPRCAGFPQDRADDERGRSHGGIRQLDAHGATQGSTEGFSRRVLRWRFVSSIRADTLAFFAEFYENAPGASTHVVELSTTVRADGWSGGVPESGGTFVGRSAGSQRRIWLRPRRFRFATSLPGPT